MTATSAAMAAAFIGGTVVAAFAIYFGVRRLVGGEPGQSTRDLAGSVIFRVSALHGLILALVFAQEIYEYNTLRGALNAEAVAAANIWNDIQRYDPDLAPPLRADLTVYLQEASGPEWTRLADEARLSARAWAAWDGVYLAVLDLRPGDPRQEALRDHMLRDVQRIAGLRQQRETEAIYGLSPLFWVAALGGVLLVIGPYFVFEPTRLHLALLGVYSGFTGLVIFIIFAFSDPYAPPGALDPLPLERVLEAQAGQSG
jgi:hypothetical protein